MRSESYLTGSVLDGGETKASIGLLNKERALFEKIDELLVAALPGEKRILEFIRTRTAEWDVKLTCESCGA